MLSANRLPMTMGCIPKCKRGGVWWRPVGRHINAACGSPPLLVADATTFAPLGSMSLDFRGALLPYKSSSFATPLRRGTMGAGE